MTTKRNHLTVVQSKLQGAGLAIPDGQIYPGLFHEGMADWCIAMQETGGPGPDDFFGGSAVIQHPRVQVHLRDPDQTRGRQVANAAWTALHLAEPGDYDHIRCMQDTPLPIGQDGDGRYRWSINLELWIYE